MLVIAGRTDAEFRSWLQLDREFEKSITGNKKEHQELWNIISKMHTKYECMIEHQYQYTQNLMESKANY